MNYYTFENITVWKLFSEICEYDFIGSLKLLNPAFILNPMNILLQVANLFIPKIE